MKRRPSREVACTGKAAMPAVDAKRVARHLSERGDRIVAYRCIHCGKWHVGNSSGPRTFSRRPRAEPEDSRYG